MFSTISENQIFILILWFTALLILWNMRRHITFLNKKRMVASIAAISFLALFFGWGLDFWHQGEKAPLSNRIAIFAMPVFEGEQQAELQPEGLALAELTASAFNANQSGDLHAYPILALYKPLNPDSLANVHYLKRIALATGFPYFLIGSLQRAGDSTYAQCSLYQANRSEPFRQMRLAWHKGGLVSASRQFVAGIAQALGGLVPGQLDLSQKPVGYYNTRLAILGNQHQQAKQLAMKQLSQDSSSVDALLNFAMLELADRELQAKSKKERDQALRRLSLRLAMASDRDSSYAPLAILAGKAFYWREKFNDAALYTLRALRHSAFDDSEMYSLLAKLHYSRYRQLGFLNEVEVYRYALRCNPANIDVVVDLAGVYIVLKQTEQGQKLLERYHAIFPENLQLMRALGEIYVMRGLTEKLFATYEKILQHDPTDADAYYNLGIYYFNSTDTLTAKRFFEKAIKIGHHRDSRLYLAKIAERQNNYPEAIAQLRERIRLRNGEDDAYAEEARRHLFELMLMLGKIDSTGKVLE